MSRPLTSDEERERYGRQMREREEEARHTKIKALQDEQINTWRHTARLMLAEVKARRAADHGDEVLFGNLQLAVMRVVKELS